MRLLKGKDFKAFFYVFDALNIMKFTRVIHMKKCRFSIKNALNFRIQDNAKDFWYKIGKGSKYIFNYVSWFVSILINFNTLCDA